MENQRYAIVEFEDGLQIIPSIWINAGKKSTIWPSHFKTKLRINKAVIGEEMPKERTDWEVLPIKKIFGSVGTYEKGVEKLNLAQDTSNIESDNLSECPARKRRRIKAKRVLSSSSSQSEDDEDVVSKLPSIPDLNTFVGHRASINEYTQNIIPEEESSQSSILNNARTSNFTKDVSNNQEFQKLICSKLNKILYKIEAIENSLQLLERKIDRSSSKEEEETEITMPLMSLGELEDFEENLNEPVFKRSAINALKFMGGNNLNSNVHNIMKKAVANVLAVKFSWAGKKGKKVFKNLGLSKVIIQAVRLSPNCDNVTEYDITKLISKWLAQATLRMQRENNLVPSSTFIRNSHE